MKAPLTLAATLSLLLLALPDACHHHIYSIWRYPTRQPRCPLADQRVRASASPTKI